MSDPTGAGLNDHRSHLQVSVRSQEPLTLPQNSIGSLRGDVRLDLYQSVEKNIPALERQRADGLPSMRGGRMLSRSFRAKNGLLGPIQVRFPSFLVFSYVHEASIVLSIL
ncbi:hypothetical protein CRG98_011368 [Punica granatum]|uniref:Uncharacterized protein n=1 Tax=Punica granatum TaxID=22663 RepID=A0A2I0KI90_PUNGR|nr:hypothetical protein CRG98_011368 [Punica granatum]